MFKRGWGFISAVACSVTLAGASVLGTVLAQTQQPAADPVTSLKTFSDFAQVDLARLLDGEVLTERGSLMNFANGIATHCCYAVPSTAAETARRIRGWDASPYETLKVFAFQPVSIPVAATDFAKLNFQADSKPLRWLMDRTLATTGAKSELNLSRAEAATLAECAGKKADASALAACWRKLLAARVAAFQAQGPEGSAAYEMGAETVSPGNQIRALLRDQLAVAREFSPVLSQSGLLSNRGTATLTPLCYWSLFTADHRATISLGATYQVAIGDRYQQADIEYYVSGSYFASVTLHEIWPIRVGDRMGALVWRADLIAAPTLAYTKGIDRMAYGAIMVQEVKKSIRCFQEDLKGKR